MSDSPLVIEDLSFRYRDRQGAAIHNISFEARAGEILLIAGASGCGKTTLIRCINGLIPRSYKGDVTGRRIPWGTINDLQEESYTPCGRRNDMTFNLLYNKSLSRISNIKGERNERFVQS